MKGVKEISVFVDESGSFESDEESSWFYLICFVLHDQSVDITQDVAALEGRFRDNVRMLNEYEKLKIYYDNGQAQVKALLEEAFAMFSSSVEFVQDVKPENYRLFQAADLLCSVELVAAKMHANCMSVSESRFFGKEREFKRNILKQIKAKEL